MRTESGLGAEVLLQPLCPRCRLPSLCVEGLAALMVFGRPGSTVSFSQPRPAAGESICSRRPHRSGLSLEEASRGSAEGAALGRVFRERQSVAMFAGFLCLHTQISGAHSGLSTCPCLTTLLTFGCLGSATQMVAEMSTGDLKSSCFSQSLRSFRMEHMAMLCLFEKAFASYVYTTAHYPKTKILSLLLPIC